MVAPLSASLFVASVTFCKKFEMSSTLQPELDLATAPPDPAVADLVTLLSDEPGWITAAQLLVKAQWPVTDANKRKLRDLASQSNGQIISGQRGYRHIRHATIEEIEHAANWLQHQAKEMDQRAYEIRRQRHTFHPAS
jgi:hypothetical protein